MLMVSTSMQVSIPSTIRLLELLSGRSRKVKNKFKVLTIEK
jgi:hypothetical protein